MMHGKVCGVQISKEECPAGNEERNTKQVKGLEKERLPDDYVMAVVESTAHASTGVCSTKRLYIYSQ